MKRIGVLTSGGDGPGFNPCVRAVVRMAASLDVEVVGIRRGFAGLLDHEFVDLPPRAVGGIVGRGGTFLGTARSPEFATRHGQIEGLRNLNEAEIEGLVVIGGDGSMRGGQKLLELGLPVMGVPGTIDNDLLGTDMSIGVDTALNTALDAVDRVKDTASSHQRAFLVEVMGRNSGYLALMTGIAGGAEMVCIPEEPFELEDVGRTVTDAYIKGKSHCIIIVAEGARYNAVKIAEYLNARREEAGFSVRVTILGHIQRGGSPSAFDRILATRLGAAATKALIEGRRGQMVGLVGNEIVFTPFDKVLGGPKPIDVKMFQLARVLEK